MNRAERRAQEHGKQGVTEPQAAAKAKEILEPPTPQDVTDVRAKNSGRGKKTADKWNQ